MNDLYWVYFSIKKSKKSDIKEMLYKVREYSLDEFTVTLADSEDKYFGENFKTIHFHEVVE